jgi:hypothetical protein
VRAVVMGVALHILAMLPANVIGHSAVPSGARAGEAAILVAFVAVGLVLAVRVRGRG